MVSSVQTTALHSRTAPPGARVARTDSAAPSDRVTLSGPGVPEAEERTTVLPLAAKIGLAAFAALGLAGGLAGPASAQISPPPPAFARESRNVVTLRSQPEVVSAVRTYLTDMVENNRIQGETLNTYGKSFSNNWYSLARMEARILANPSSLNDPAIRRVYERIEAALDSAQIFEDAEEGRLYRSGAQQTVQTLDGTIMTIPSAPVQRTFQARRDYSGAARMTDATMESIDGILKGNQ